MSVVAATYLSSKMTFSHFLVGRVPLTQIKVFICQFVCVGGSRYLPLLEMTFSHFSSAECHSPKQYLVANLLSRETLLPVLFDFIILATKLNFNFYFFAHLKQSVTFGHILLCSLDICARKT